MAFRVCERGGEWRTELANRAFFGGDVGFGFGGGDEAVAVGVRFLHDVTPTFVGATPGEGFGEGDEAVFVGVAFVEHGALFGVVVWPPFGGGEFAVLVGVAGVEDVVDDEVTDFFAGEFAVFVEIGLGEAGFEGVVFDGGGGLAGAEEDDRGEEEGETVHGFGEV